MTRKQKSIEEQLAETLANQRRIAARLQALEARRKARDTRRRDKAERALLRIVIDLLTAQPAYQQTINDAIAVSQLRSDEREAIAWLMDQLKAPTPQPEIDQPTQRVA